MKVSKLWTLNGVTISQLGNGFYVAKVEYNVGKGIPVNKKYIEAKTN